MDWSSNGRSIDRQSKLKSNLKRNPFRTVQCTFEYFRPYFKTYFTFYGETQQKNTSVKSSMFVFDPLIAVATPPLLVSHMILFNQAPSVTHLSWRCTLTFQSRKLRQIQNNIRICRISFSFSSFLDLNCTFLSQKYGCFVQKRITVKLENYFQTLRLQFKIYFLFLMTMIYRNLSEN